METLPRMLTAGENGRGVELDPGGIRGVELRSNLIEFASEPIGLRFEDANTAKDEIILFRIARRAGIVQIKEVQEKGAAE